MQGLAALIGIRSTVCSSHRHKLRIWRSFPTKACSTHTESLGFGRRDPTNLMRTLYFLACMTLARANLVAAQTRGLLPDSGYTFERQTRERWLNGSQQPAFTSFTYSQQWAQIDAVRVARAPGGWALYLFGAMLLALGEATVRDPADIAAAFRSGSPASRALAIREIGVLFREAARPATPRRRWSCMTISSES